MGDDCVGYWRDPRWGMTVSCSRLLEGSSVGNDCVMQQAIGGILGGG